MSDRNRLPLFELSAKLAQCRDQAQVLKRCGMQVVRHVPDLLGELDRATLHRRQLAHHLGIVEPAAQPALEAADHD